MPHLAYPSDAAAQATAHGALPYVAVALICFVIILFFTFASNSAVGGSLIHAFFGGYVAVVVFCGLVLWGLATFIPEITGDNNFTLFSWTAHDTGFNIAIGLTSVSCVVLLARVGRVKRRRRRRGGFV